MPNKKSQVSTNFVLILFVLGKFRQPLRCYASLFCKLHLPTAKFVIKLLSLTGSGLRLKTCTAANNILCVFLVTFVCKRLPGFDQNGSKNKHA